MGKLIKNYPMMLATHNTDTHTQTLRTPIL